MTYELVNPEELGAPRGWTHGMLGPAGGRVLFVAGQAAAGPEGDVEEEDFVRQFGIALVRALAVVRDAGGTPADVGRITIYVTDVDEYRARRREVGAVYRERMGRHYPAMALVEVRRLAAPGAKVELEVTAILEEVG